MSAGIVLLSEKGNHLQQCFQSEGLWGRLQALQSQRGCLKERALDSAPKPVRHFKLSHGTPCKVSVSLYYGCNLQHTEKEVLLKDPMQNGGGCCYEHDSMLPWAVPESCTSEGISTSALTGVSWDITTANNLWAAACEGPSARCLACQRQQAASCEASLPEHFPSCWAAPGAEWHQHSNLLLTQTPGMMFKQTVYGMFMKTK